MNNLIRFMPSRESQKGQGGAIFLFLAAIVVVGLVILALEAASSHPYF